MRRIMIILLQSLVFVSPAIAAQKPVGQKFFAQDSDFFGSIDVQYWSVTNLNSASTSPSDGLKIGGGYNYNQYAGVEFNFARSGTGIVIEGVVFV